MGIHPHQDIRHAEDISKYLEKKFRLDPNTYFVYFSGSINDKYYFDRIKRGTSIPRKNFILLEPSGQPTTFFNAYKKPFTSIIASLGRKMGKKEQAEIISFGGSTKSCYKSICPEARSKIREILGEKRIGKFIQHLPVMWRKPEGIIQKPRAQRPKPKTHVRK